MELTEICDQFWSKPQDESLRESLQLVINEILENIKILDKSETGRLTETIEKAINLSNDLTENQIRLLKGFTMLIRNVSVLGKHDLTTLIKFKSILSLTSKTFILISNNNHAIQLSSLAALSVLNFPQVLNFSPKGIEDDLIAFKILSKIIDSYGLTAINTQALCHLLPMYITKDHDDLRVELFFKGKQEFTMLLLSLCNSSGIYPGMELDTFLEINDVDVRSIRQLMIKIVNELMTHESFGGLLCKIEKFQYKPKDGEDINCSSIPLIYLTQLICENNLTNIELDHLDMISLASWTMEYFKIVKIKSEELLVKQLLSNEEEIKLGYHHRKVIAILDIMATHIEMNVIVKTFDEYNLLVDLIDLFKTIEHNTLKPKLKDNIQIQPGFMIKGKKQFPGVKSILIEIITALVHFNKLNQDVVRENQGIELILNNCNLDMNEPFIKERSILCIKHLLEDNQGNQNFIKSLEVKGTEITEETDEVLTKAGYEVEIVNGKIELKKSDERKDMESKVL